MCSKPRNIHLNKLFICPNEVSKRNFNADNIDILLPNSFVKDFRILEKLGEVKHQTLEFFIHEFILLKGKQAIVYKIQNRTTLEYYAAKIYQTKDLETISSVYIFSIIIFSYLLKFLKIIREANILRQMNHHGIIKFADFIEDQTLGIYIILTEFFPSITLQSFIRKNSLKLEDQILIFQRIFEAIVYLHQKSIVHRDLTPNNILINPENFQIRIIDFGLSRSDARSSEFDFPEGNLKYRPPTLEIFENLFVADHWNAGLIFLSLFLQRNVTTKIAYLLFDETISKNLLIDLIIQNLKSLMQGKSEAAEHSWNFLITFLY